MPSELSFVTDLCQQLGGAEFVVAKKLFGEYALYVGPKLVALVCDNQLFVKPTNAGRAFLGEVLVLGEVTEAAPYSGAKPCFLIASRLDDTVWLSQLLQVTADALPLPKPKKS
jgi:DNA transformation protein and related proteins